MIQAATQYIKVAAWKDTNPQQVRNTTIEQAILGKSLSMAYSSCITQDKIS